MKFTTETRWLRSQIFKKSIDYLSSTLTTMEDYQKYEKEYSEESLWNTVKKWSSKLGEEAIYNICLLYYLAKSPYLPTSEKMKVLGALGYLILPVDAIPDFIPLAGLTDDIGAIAYLIKSLATYITPEIKQKARERAHRIIH